MLWWDKFQNDYDRDRDAEAAKGSKGNVASIDAKYQQRRGELQKSIDGWYGEIKEPAAPPSLGKQPANQPAAPAPKAGNQPGAGKTLSSTAIARAAKDAGISVDEATKQAKSQGYKVK